MDVQAVKLYLDTETFSETPIKYGTYRYIQDCELMVVTWAVDDGPVNCLDCTCYGHEDGLTMLANLMQECTEIIAHNAMFDRGVIAKHFPNAAPPLEKWRCTMVKAMAHSLPGSLDKLCDILQVPQDQRKLKIGKDLVRMFCMPRPKNVKLRRATRETHPTEWASFLDYAKADIAAMREVDKRLPTWNYTGRELDLWHLDQRINDRGFAVDLDLANAAIEATDREQARLATRTQDMTNGEVQKATQRDAMLDHILAEYLISLPDLQGATLERRIADPDLPQGLKDLLAIRLQASTTSTSKYKALIRGATTDGRLKGTLQFDGAGRTGRWSGRTFQPQNLPRPALDHDEIEFGIDVIKAGAADLLYGNVMQLTSSAIRGCIVAPQGKKLCVSDLSNIEGRKLAWLAGEKWKLQAFRDFDNGTGPDLYKLAYAKSFNIPHEDVSKSQRQIGKVEELMLGYEGGVGAFITGAATYRFDVEELGIAAWPTLPEGTREEAEEFHDWTVSQKRSTFGLSRRAFVTCDTIKRLWRQAHPNVATLWKDLEAACVSAVESPGRTIPCRKFKVRRDGAWLRIGLPSGRALCYPQPRVDDGKLSYMGVNQYTRKWERIKTYGGKLVENCTQGAARDVMAHNMPAIDAAGYRTVLSMHDELLTETPDLPEYNERELSALLATVPDWAEGLPLAAAGFESYRYRKD
ncbi:DNA polymerase [Sulfurimicrobium lacus]|uniref:DNA-directed DNA polymerase n=1 Tax=Sulfurimicrobium lacus TaxID=2715678 RepID=A0A6F8VE71_9PROT|nr:DNA polymerase [Sulfurimicrobium lacus]BCB27029.1 DNA polymerase [Sulfurimicrobium lacus]